MKILKSLAFVLFSIVALPIMSVCALIGIICALLATSFMRGYMEGWDRLQELRERGKENAMEPSVEPPTVEHGLN